MTNSPWSFSVHALQTELALDALTLINDFAAVSHAVPHLSRNDVVAVGADAATLASERRDGHYSVLGPGTGLGVGRSEEHTSELQSLMRISYAVFCLKKNNKQKQNN